MKLKEEEGFNSSSLDDNKVTKIHDSSNLNEDQSVSHKLTQKVPIARRPASLSSLRESMMDEMTQFPSVHHSNGSIKVFMETAL